MSGEQRATVVFERDAPEAFRDLVADTLGQSEFVELERAGGVLVVREIDGE